MTECECWDVLVINNQSVAVKSVAVITHKRTCRRPSHRYTHTHTTLCAEPAPWRAWVGDVCARFKRLCRRLIGCCITPMMLHHYEFF